MFKGTKIDLREKAYLLRTHNKSYNEINHILNIPKSTLSYWFRRDNNSKIIKEKLIKKSQKKAIKHLKLLALSNKKKWIKIHLNYRQKGRSKFTYLLSKRIFCAGIFIYWGEGDKKLENGIVRISNVDHRILRIFIIFLINICKISITKIRLCLLLYPDLNDNKCKEYWSTKLYIPIVQFLKSQYIQGRSKIRKVNYGVCTVQVYSRELKEMIFEWINLYSDHLINNAGIV